MKFSTKITKWYQQNKRDLPWRKTSDAYRIWLSEIILQQTRIEQGTSYYLRFVEAFPTVQHLAEASEDQVLKLWQGLGYYTRARNLHKTARLVVAKYNGSFPTSISEIKELPGIGDYTAAAILSIAFQKSYPVVDGNVFRVLARYQGISTPIDSTSGKREFTRLAADLMSNSPPGTFNQALMEYGALVCTPVNPACASCIFKADCVAFRTDQVKSLPVKKVRINKRIRYFYYIIFQFSGNDSSQILINKRGDKDIWTNLYDFPLIESEKPLSIEAIRGMGYKGISLINITINPMGNQYKHILSHQVILASFIRVEVRQKVFAELQKNIQDEELIPINTRDLVRYPIPRLIDKFLKENSLDESSEE